MEKHNVWIDGWVKWMTQNYLNDEETDINEFKRTMHTLLLGSEFLVIEMVGHGMGSDYSVSYFCWGLEGILDSWGMASITITLPDEHDRFIKSYPQLDLKEI